MVVDRREYVYFARPVGMDGPIKIGWSNAPEQRILNLMTWSPFPLELVVMISGGRELEKNIHECFADLHSHGEWFRADPRLVDAIYKLVIGFPVGQAIDLEKRIGRIGKVGRKIKKRPPEFGRRQSYKTRMRHAMKRAERADGRDCYYSEPDDAGGILNAWSCDLNAVPTEQEIARLEEVIADPAKHGIPHLRNRKGFYEAEARAQ